MRKKQVATVEEVGTRLTEWRQSRQKGAAVPDELWSAAIEVARRDGVTRTATALHLDGGKLKLAHDGSGWGCEENDGGIVYGIDRARGRGGCAMRDRSGGPAREDPDRT